MSTEETIEDSLKKLELWAEDSQWRGYDTFDGLSSPYAKWFTFDQPLLKQCWQQGVRRFVLNLRPLLGVKRSMSTKGMGFFAQGYLRMYQVTGEEKYREKAEYCLHWLKANRCQGYEGYCWGNHFDYQSRGGNIAKGMPTIVWTGLIAHAFLDAYEALGVRYYFEVACSACRFILDEMGWLDLKEGVMLRYYPDSGNLIHNSNMIGASLLARVCSIEPDSRFSMMAERAVQYTLAHQTDEGAWSYGVGDKWSWVDSFHTGYVLESLAIFINSTGSVKYLENLNRGYRYFITTFFLPDGTPRYYDKKTLPVDIQCASQGIQTLVNLQKLDADSIPTAVRVAKWTIKHMQDKSGYFYYRKYPLLTNKTPTLHWGQATMFAALALLNQQLHGSHLESESALAS